MRIEAIYLRVATYIELVSIIGSGDLSLNNAAVFNALNDSSISDGNNAKYFENKPRTIGPYIYLQLGQV